jgi:hypothetical protein
MGLAGQYQLVSNNRPVSEYHQRALLPKISSERD